MIPRIPPIAVVAIGGLVVGYSLHAQIVGQSQRTGQNAAVHPPEIRRAIPVEPEIRKAIPLQPAVAPSSGSAIQRTTAVPTHVGAPVVAPATSPPVGNGPRTSPTYTYSPRFTPSYTRSPSIPGYYNRYYDYNYRPPVGEHYVHNYIRSDGTFVSGHYRTNRDDSFWNNYSSYGNINPHTGRTGYKLPRVGRSTYGLRLH
jgi:hypothetical protein